MKGKITREEIDQSLITTIDSIEQYYMIGSLEYFINNSTGKRIVVDIDITEETINVNRNNIELLIYSTINTSAFNVNGDNITITFLGNGNIKGTLKSHKTTQTTPNNTNVLFFDNGHSFVKGDLVTTSYGLGGDGKNHATVLSVTETTITVDKNTHASIPSNVDIGSFYWGGLLNFNGKNTICNNININNSHGYLLTSSTPSSIIINGGVIDNSGLDIALLKNSIITLNNVYIGKIIDCAKSGFVLQGATLILNDCIMNKNNSDADFVIYDSSLKSSIYANRCRFLNDNNHQAPFDYNKYTLISIQSQRSDRVVENIKFTDCYFTNSIHGLFHKNNDNFNPIIENIEFDNCNIKDGIGELRYFKVWKCNFNNCDFNEISTSDKEFILNDNYDINVNNSKFTNINCKFSLVFNAFNCSFINSNILISDKFRYEDIYIKESSINAINAWAHNTVMTIKNLIIDDVNLQLHNISGDASSKIALNVDNDILKFKYPNSDHEHYLLSHVGRTFYDSKFYTSFNKLPRFSKYEYLLSNDSIFYDVSMNEYKRIGHVNFKEILNINKNQVYCDTSRVAVNDYINILKHNEAVESIKIIEVNNDYLTLEKEFDDNYYNNCCTFRIL